MRGQIFAVGLVLARVLASGSAHAAHTLNSVTYDPATGQIRFIVIPDDDAQLQGNARQGERQVLIRKGDFEQLAPGEGLKLWLGVNEVDQGVREALPEWAQVEVKERDRGVEGSNKGESEEDRRIELEESKKIESGVAAEVSP